MLQTIPKVQKELLLLYLNLIKDSSTESAELQLHVVLVPTSRPRERRRERAGAHIEVEISHGAFTASQSCDTAKVSPDITPVSDGYYISITSVSHRSRLKVDTVIGEARTLLCRSVSQRGMSDHVLRICDLAVTSHTLHRHRSCSSQNK